MLPAEMGYAKHSYYVYVIRTEDRDKVMEQLKEKGCGCAIHYPVALHLQPAFASLSGREGDQPVAERYAKEIISIPMFPELTEGQVAEASSIIKEVVGG